MPPLLQSKLAASSGKITPEISQKAKGLLEQAKIDKAASDQANSFGGLLKSTLTGLPSAAVSVAKNTATGLKDMVVNPSPEQRSYESQMLPRATNPILKTITDPGVTVARGITRVLNPGLQPLASDIAEPIAIREKGGIADQIASGKIAPNTLDEFPSLKKTPLQVVGDTSQAVLSAYAGGEAENLASKGLKQPLVQALKTGAESGLKTGTAFGTSQALSSGSKNPLELASTIGTSGALGGGMGAVAASVGPVTTGILEQAREAKALQSSVEPQAGFIKNPLGEEPIPEPSHNTSEQNQKPLLSPVATSELSSSTGENLPPIEAPTLQRLPSTQPDPSGVPSLSNPTPAFDPEQYVKEQVAKREGAKTQGNPSIIGKAKSFLADAKAKLVDFTAPIEDTLYAAQKKSKFSLLPKDDIHNQIDRVLRAPTLAGQFAKDNGMIDVIRKVDNPDALDQYMIAKHGVELTNQGIQTGRDLAKDTVLVEALAPKYEETAQKVSAYSQKLLDYSAETGLISKDLADKLKTQYPDYVPFNRVFSEVEKQMQSGTRAVASLSKQTAVQKIVGSSREIESPLQSLLAKTNDVFKQGEKNQAAKLLASYEKLPDNPFNLTELKPGESADHTISFLDQGEKRTFSTTKEIAEAAKALNVQQLGILGRIASFPVRIARVGITGLNIPFIGANMAKDAVSAFINSDKALQTSIANPNNFVRSLFSAVKHDALYEEMVRAGGAGTSYDISRNQAEHTFQDIRGLKGVKDLRSAGGYIVRTPGNLLRAVENIIGRGEEFTRIQQYRGTKEALLRQGMDKENAMIGGARQSREATVNFARRGEWGTVLNSTFLYLNAGIQGTRTLLRGLKTRPLQTATKIAVSAMFPVAVATTWNLSDPERRKAYEDIAEYEKENNIIIVPPHPTQDANGKWNVIKIPLSQEINNIVSLARRPIEQAHGLDPVGFGDFANALLGTVSPIAPTKGAMLSSLTPQIIKPTIEAAVNKNLFTGYPQVSDSLSKLSPENQVKPSTSKFAITMGQKLGVSPIKIDEFVKGTFGGVGQQITGQQNVIDATFARFGKATGGAVDNKATGEIQGVLQKQADNRAEIKSEAEQLYSDIKTLPKAEARIKVLEAAKKDPAIIQKLTDVAEAQKLGLTYKDKTVKQLGVTNGERAKYIAGEMKKLKTKEEKKAYLKEQIQKKIVTEAVAEQLMYYLKQ